MNVIIQLQVRRDMNNIGQNIFAGIHLSSDKHPLLQKSGDIHYLLNGDISGYENEGNISFVQNVLGNSLCYEFPTGWEYRGAIRLDQERFAIILDDGEKGRIDLFDANTCTSTTKLISECIHTPDEIVGSYKLYEGSPRIYWTNQCLTPKIFDIEKCIPYKSLTDCDDCKDEFSSDVDCEALELSRCIKWPCPTITNYTGGLIPGGVYQIAIAFTENGQRISDYHILPQVIKLFDKDNNTFGINIEFEGCISDTFDQYEVVLIAHREDRGTEAQRVGYFHASQNQVGINRLDTNENQIVENALLLQQSPYIRGSEFLDVNNESLILAQPKLGFNFDYRPQACQIKSKWKSVRVSASNAGKYPSYMRDEVYSHYISWQLPNGSWSHKTHIPSDALSTFIGDHIGFDSNSNAEINNDNFEVTQSSCDQIDKKYWEIYNTATVTNVNIVDEQQSGEDGLDPLGGGLNCAQCEEEVEAEGLFAYWESRDYFYPEDYPCIELRCKPIRYHKFPSNCVSYTKNDGTVINVAHIHNNSLQYSGDTSDTLINPDVKCREACVNIMAIAFENIQPPLDMNGNPIPVKGYQIHVEDRQQNQSILHKGLLFNTGNIEKTCEEDPVKYPNYPFNDLCEDQFLTNPGNERDNFGQWTGLNDYSQQEFTFHSPDIHYVKGGNGQELCLYSEEVGRVEGLYHETKDYPKYQLPSQLAELVSQTAGIAEAAFALSGQVCKETEVMKECIRKAAVITDVDTTETVDEDTTNNGGIGATVTVDPITGTVLTTSIPIIINTVPGTIGAPPTGIQIGSAGTIKGENTTEGTNTQQADEKCECDEFGNDPNTGLQGDCYKVTEFAITNGPGDPVMDAVNPCALINPTLFNKQAELHLRVSGLTAGCSTSITICVEECTQNLGGIVTLPTCNIVEYGPIQVNSDGWVSVELNRKTSTYCGNPLLGGTFSQTSPTFSSLSEVQRSVKWADQCPCLGDVITGTKTTTNECSDQQGFIDSLPLVEQLPTLLFHYSQGINTADNIVKSFITPRNYAIQYTAKADYNAYNCKNIKKGNIRRSIELSQDVQPIRQTLNDGTRVDNWCGAFSRYLKLNAPLENPCEKDKTRLLYSDVFCPQDQNADLEDCNTGVSFGYCSTASDPETDEEVPIQAVSYYAGVKQSLPNQYQGINAGITKAVTCSSMSEDTGCIFGGDIYISQFQVVRKKPFFSNLPLTLPPNTDFNLRLNWLCAETRYWMDTTQKSVFAKAIQGIIPGISSAFIDNDYVLEPIQELGVCIKPINIDLPDPIVRLINTIGFGVIADNDADGDMVPDDLNGSDSGGGELTQLLIDILETIVGTLIPGLNGSPRSDYLSRPGVFYTHVTGVACFWGESKFNSDWRVCSEVAESQPYPLRDLADIACATDYHNRELHLYNLQYCFNGIHRQDLPENTVDLCDPEIAYNEIIYSNRTNVDGGKDNWLTFPPLNRHVFSNKDGRFTCIRAIDDYRLLVAFEDAMYVTQPEDSLTTNSGQEIYLGSPNIFDRRLQRLSDECTGFGGTIDCNSIVNTRYGVFWFDRKRKRFLNYTNQIQDVSAEMRSWFKEYANGEIIATYDNCSDNIYITDKDTGWTLTYKPAMQQFISHNSFVPDEYMCLPNNILSRNDKGLWKHNDKYCYNTYYGKTYPFEIGFLMKKEIQVHTLQSLEIYSEWKEYRGYDCSILKKNEWFDQVLVYNDCYSTGLVDTFIKDPENENHVCPPGKVGVNLMEGCIARINGLQNAQVTPPFICRDDNGCTYTLPAKQKTNTDQFNDIRGKWFKVHLRENNNKDCKITVQLALAMFETIKQ